MLSNFFSPEFVSALITLCSLVGTWIVYRTNRYLAEHLARERLRYDRQMRAANEREFRRQNETVRMLSEAYARGEPPTLDDLLSSAERDWSVKSLRTPSELRSPESLESYEDTEPTERVSTLEMATKPIRRDSSPSDDTPAPSMPRRIR